MGLYLYEPLRIKILGTFTQPAWPLRHWSFSNASLGSLSAWSGLFQARPVHSSFEFQILLLEMAFPDNPDENITLINILHLPSSSIVWLSSNMTNSFHIRKLSAVIHVKKENIQKWVIWDLHGGPVRKT